MTFDADEKLLDFVKEDEGSPPPVFVGREKALEDIEDTGARAWRPVNRAAGDRRPAKRGAPKNTRIIQGAPGAGKTSILAELVKRSSERDGAPGQSRVLAFNSTALVNSLPEVLRIVAAAGSLEPVRWRDALPNLTMTLDGTGFPSVSIDFAGAPDVPAPKTLFDLARQRPRESWTAPVIVAVDEAQRLPGNATDPHALFLQGIHDADAGLPLSLVLAGLGDTRQKGEDMGLTRPSAVHEIGGLDAEETATLMRDFCRHFGMDPSGHEGRLDALAAPCEGWPRHLHFAMQALAAESLRCGGDLAGVDWARCGNQAAESRAHYYQHRQSAEMKESDGLVAVVMSRLAEGTKMSGALRLIEENVIDHVPGHRLPEDMTAKGLYTHLVHRGALQEREDGIVHCPIPSFRSHLVRAGGLHMAEAIREGDSKAIEPAAQERERSDLTLQLACAFTERISPAGQEHWGNLRENIEKRLAEADRRQDVSQAVIEERAKEIARKRAEADIRVEATEKAGGNLLHEFEARFEGEPNLPTKEQEVYDKTVRQDLERLSREDVRPGELELAAARLEVTSEGTPHADLARDLAKALGFGTVADADKIRDERAALPAELEKGTEGLMEIQKAELLQRLYRSCTVSELSDLSLGRGPHLDSLPDADARSRVSGTLESLMAVSIPGPVPWNNLNYALARSRGIQREPVASMIATPGD